jgi:hypothetical protein
MNPLIKEIEDELKRTRLDKDRLYSLLIKIVENCGGSATAGPAGPPGPAGPTGAQGPTGPAGPACECKAHTTKAPVKKKLVTTSVV